MTPEAKATEAPRGRTRGQMGRCVFGTFPAEPSKCILPIAIYEYLHIYKEKDCGPNTTLYHDVIYVYVDL